MDEMTTTTTFDAVLRALAEAPSVRPLDLDLEGRKIGRYSVERRLGQGGTSVVYEALDAVLGRKVALKVLRASERGSGTTRARLHEEARRIAALQHPHIATVYDVGEHDGIVFLALERAGGASLRARLAASPPLAPERVIAILRAVASGLACAHEAGIVHRDLKPENVVVGDGGTVKIVDFGIATLTGRGAGPAGTRRYMAPEQAAGQPASARVDVFAFGVLARELLAASVVRARDRGLRAALRRLADTCTASDPEARPRDGAALVDALDAIAAPARGSLRSHLVTLGTAAAAIALVTAARVVPAPPAEPHAAPVRSAPPPSMRVTRWHGAPSDHMTPEGASNRALPDDSPARWIPRGADAATPGPEDEIAADDRISAEGIRLAGAVPRPDVVAPASFASPPGSELPATAFVDASGRLVVSVDGYGRVDGYGAPAGVAPGRPRAAAPLAPLAERAQAKVLADGKGGAVIQVTLHVRPPRGSTGGDDGAGAVSGVGAVEQGKVPGTGALPTAGAKSSRDLQGKDSLHLLDPIDKQADPSVSLPTHGSGAGGKSGPVRHFFCAERAPVSIRVVTGEGGVLEIVTGGDEATDLEVLAIIDVSGEVIETADGFTMCDALDAPLVTFDG